MQAAAALRAAGGFGPTQGHLSQLAQRLCAPVSSSAALFHLHGNPYPVMRSRASVREQGAGVRKRGLGSGHSIPRAVSVTTPPAGPCGHSPSRPSGSGPRAPSPWRPGSRRQRGSGAHRWSQDGQAWPQTPPGSHRGLQETGRHAPRSVTPQLGCGLCLGISGPGELCLARAGRRLQAEMLGRPLDPGPWAVASALTCEKAVGFWWVGLGDLGGDRFLCPVQTCTAVRKVGAGVSAGGEASPGSHADAHRALSTVARARFKHLCPSLSLREGHPHWECEVLPEGLHWSRHRVLGGPSSGLHSEPRPGLPPLPWL